MAIDGFFIKNLIEESKSSLIDFRLDKISQLDEDIFSFSLYFRGNRNFLNFKLKPPHASFFITDEELLNNNIESNFLNQLKRNILGYRLINISQHKLDRTVLFEFKGFDLLKGELSKYLVIELMGRYNNLILLNSDYTIIDAYIKNLSHTNRSILNNIKYEYFPSDKKLFELNDYINTNDNLYYSKNFIGISPILSKYMVNNNIDIFNKEIKATKLVDEKKFYWFDCFDENINKVHYNSLSSLILNLVQTKNVNKSKYESFINKYINNLNNKLHYLNNDLNSSISNLKLKDYGNYIYSSGLNLNDKINEFVSYDNKVIKLDINKTLLENAKIFFNKYNKAKRSISHLEKQIIETNNLLKYFNDLKYDLNNINDDFKDLEAELINYGFKSKKRQLKKKDKRVNYLELNYLDYKFYVGRNARENSYIVDHISNKEDYWFHIKDIPGSHVLLKGKLTDDSLKIASMLAKYYSKEKETNTSLINYTKRKYLKKIPKMPSSQVILTKHDSINIKIDKELLNKIFIANKLNF